MTTGTQVTYTNYNALVGTYNAVWLFADAAKKAAQTRAANQAAAAASKD